MKKRFSLFVIVIVSFTLLVSLSSLFISEWSMKTSQEIVSAIPLINSGNGLIKKKENMSPINIGSLRSQKFDSRSPKIEKELAPGSNYKRYIASFDSEGNKIFGLLTVPVQETPDDGYSAIVFNHGYIPPNQYVTTEKYIAHVDYLAKNGFVVFKIDLRGNGDSEGTPSGTYFSPNYSIDAINAIKSLQKRKDVNSKKIGMWGHSMAGNLVLRAMLIEDSIKAGVIWAGAVYSYEDFAEYGLNDSSYVRRPRTEQDEEDEEELSEISKKVRELRENPEEIDFTDEFWGGISLTQNINYLNAPVQLHHSVNDSVVDIGYSRDLAKVLKENEKSYEAYEYNVGGHNINSPSFEVAMKRTVDFFKKNLDSEL